MKEPKIRIQYNKAYYYYNPKEDITTFELAKLHQWLAVQMVSPMYPLDSDAYIDRYNLLRHFDVE